MKKKKIIRDKKQKYGVFNTLQIKSKRSEKFLMAIVNIVNQKKLDKIITLKVVEHPIEERFIVTFVNDIIWNGTVAEVKEYQKQGAFLLIELFENKIMDIITKKNIFIKKLREN